MNIATRTRDPIRGESMVWLTGLALALAVTMAVALLGVIVWNGAEVFWPRRVDAVAVDEGGRQVALLAQEVKARQRSVQAGGGRIEHHREIQLYLGNKDVYGLTYRWIDAEDVRSRSRPDEAMVVERLEYGDAVGFPQALVGADGGRIAAGDARFRAALADAIARADALRGFIRVIEKGSIGDNSRAIRDQELALRRAPGDAAAQRRLADLRAEYQRLAADAAVLRRHVDAERLVLRLADGQERDIPMGKVLAAWWPNRAGPLERLGHAAGRLWEFVWDDPREANTEGGIFPAIFGTFVMTLLMSVAVVPFGVLAAIYLREYARQGPLVRAVRIAVNNLAGVPSIVFGVFGLGFFVYLVGGTADGLLFADSLPNPTFGTGGILWAALTLALMTVPVVIVATEEAISAVPRGMREGSLACGASKWQTIQRIVLPASVPGILTGLILAMARGAGEVAPLMMVGVVKLAPSLPLDLEWPFVHLDRKFMHLGFHIYDLGFQSPDSEAAQPMVFATTFLLILLVLILNLGAIVIRDRLRRRFATAAF